MNEEIIKHDISIIKEYIEINKETTVIKTLLIIDYLEKYMNENAQLKKQIDEVKEYFTNRKKDMLINIKLMKENNIEYSAVGDCTIRDLETVSSLCDEILSKLEEAGK